MATALFRVSLILLFVVFLWVWRCPIHWLTEWLCPGCGLTRAVIAFYQGQWSRSIDFHPLGPIVALGLIPLMITVLQGRLEELMVWVERRLGQWAPVLLLAAISWGVLRNI